MVVLFDKLPCHIQAKIVEKVNFWDLKEFEFSSRSGKNIANMVSEKVSLDAHSIEVRNDVLIIFYDPKTYRYIHTNIDHILEIPRHPRFTVSQISVYQESKLHDFLTQLRERNFVFKNVLLSWNVYQNPSKTSFLPFFVKMFEMLNITTFINAGYIDTDVLWLPNVLELETLYIFNILIPDDVFLNLKARYIQFIGLESAPKVGLTLNRYFQQWFFDEREIGRFEYRWSYASESPEDVEPENLFSNLPFSVLWTKESHKSSVVSQTPLTAIDTEYQDQNIYLIQSESKKLIVNLKSDRIEAYEVIDEKNELLRMFHLHHIPPSLPNFPIQSSRSQKPSRFRNFLDLFRKK